MKRIFFKISIIMLSVSVVCAGTEKLDWFNWSELPSLPPVGGQEQALGVAGPFVGVHNDVLIVAGGANFPVPQWHSSKVWQKDICVLIRDGESYKWITGFDLDKPLAYGASVSTPYGVLCMGGNDSSEVYTDVFLLKWDSEKQQINKQVLPELPMPCAYGSAAMIGEKVYLAGGTSASGLETAMNNFWMLDLSKIGKPKEFEWQSLPSWHGPKRAFNITVVQHDGTEDCVYVMSGRRLTEPDDSQSVEFLADVYAFSPSKYTGGVEAWRKCESLPKSVCAGTAISSGQTHIFVFGGADGSLVFKAEELKEKHPGFPKDVLAYQTITDTWTKVGILPASHVTTSAVLWDGKIVIPSGEIMPRIRSAKIWEGDLVKKENQFGAINFMTLGLYLLGMIGVGVFFARRNKNTDDFFRGG